MSLLDADKRIDRMSAVSRKRTRSVGLKYGRAGGWDGIESRIERDTVEILVLEIT